MWMIRRKNAEELDSIVYFLSSALNAAIDDSTYLAHHRSMTPQIGAGLATSEIASRLAMFREQVCDVSQREFMLVTKLARARHWAQQLRRHEPHMRADIDAFLSVTAPCEGMVRNRATDAQSVFDGHAQPKRFLADRMPAGRVAAEAALSQMERLEAAERGELPDDDGPRYLIDGEISVEALNEACERLLTRMSVHYGWEDDSTGVENDAALRDQAATDAPDQPAENDAAVAAGAQPGKEAQEKAPDDTGGETSQAGAASAEAATGARNVDTAESAQAPTESSRDEQSGPPDNESQTTLDTDAGERDGTVAAGSPDGSDSDADADEAASAATCGDKEADDRAEPPHVAPPQQAASG